MTSIHAMQSGHAPDVPGRQVPRVDRGIDITDPALIAERKRIIASMSKEENMKRMEGMETYLQWKQENGQSR